MVASCISWLAAIWRLNEQLKADTEDDIIHRNNTHFHECRSNNAINKNEKNRGMVVMECSVNKEEIRKEFTISSSSTSSAFIHAKYGWWQATDMCAHIIFYVSAEENIPRGVAWMLLEVTVYECIVCQIQPFIPSISICIFIYLFCSCCSNLHETNYRSDWKEISGLERPIAVKFSLFHIFDFYFLCSTSWG